MIYVPQLKRYLLINVKFFVEFCVSLHEQWLSRRRAAQETFNINIMKTFKTSSTEIVSMVGYTVDLLSSGRSPVAIFNAYIAFRFELLVPFTHINIIKTFWICLAIGQSKISLKYQRLRFPSPIKVNELFHGRNIKFPMLANVKKLDCLRHITFKRFYAYILSIWIKPNLCISTFASIGNFTVFEISPWLIS